MKSHINVSDIDLKQIRMHVKVQYSFWRSHRITIVLGLQSVLSEWKVNESLNFSLGFKFELMLGHSSSDSSGLLGSEFQRKGRTLASQFISDFLSIFFIDDG